MEILSAGTSGSTAEQFFERLKSARATSVIDTRLHRSSQLAGFAKERDLRYFLPRLSSARYDVEPLLAPEDANLKAFRSKTLEWPEYEERYLDLLVRRQVHLSIDFDHWGERPVLLCSEAQPLHCHRRLAAQYLRDHLKGGVSISTVVHL